MSFPISDTGQIHGEVKRFIKEQIRLQLTFTEGEARPSKVELVFRWWSKRISSVTSRLILIANDINITNSNNVGRPSAFAEALLRKVVFCA